MQNNYSETSTRSEGPLLF